MVSVSSRSGGDTAPRSAGPAGGRRGRRLDVLDVLRSATAPLSIVAIAGELGVHPNTVRLHLEALVREGRVEQVEPDRRGPGRPPLLFRAIGGMDPAGPRQYRLLAEIYARTGMTEEAAALMRKASSIREPHRRGDSAAE